MEQERKELIKGGYRDRHFNAGSIILAFGVFEAVGGGLNTWFRTGKLFPGPHLFAGSGLYSFPIYCHRLCNLEFCNVRLLIIPLLFVQQSPCFGQQPQL